MSRFIGPILLSCGLLLLTFILLDWWPQHNRIRIATNTWLGYESLYFGVETGLIDVRKIEPVRLGSATEVIEAIKQNQVEGGGLTLDEVLLLENQGIEMRILYVADISNGADVVLAKPTTDWFDLPGSSPKTSTVIIEDTALGNFVFQRFLHYNEEKLHNVDWDIVRSPVDQHVATFSEIDADFIVTFEPVKSHLKVKGAIEVFNSKSMPGEIVDVFAVREDAFNKSPELYAELVKKLDLSVARLTSNDELAVSYLKDTLNLSTYQIKFAMKDLIFPRKHKSSQMMAVDGVLRKNVASLRDMLKDTGTLKTDCVCEPSYGQ